MKNLILPLTVGLLFSQIVISAIELTGEQEQLLDTLPVDQAVSIRQKMLAQQELTDDLEKTFKEINTLVPRPEERLDTEDAKEAFKEKSKNWIFGYDLFAASPTTFAPATEIPIPSDYVVGPGDVLSVSVIGGGNALTDRSSDITVSRDASISIPGFVPIGVAGLTLDEARKVIRDDIARQSIGAEAVITLKELRSMRIFMLGAAYMPGSYTVSSLATISNALFVSGGVNTIGSLRNIQVKRNGKTVHTFDLYDLLLNGDTSQDMRLQPGDAVFVPVIKKTVRMQGAVRRPALYELKEGETLQDLVTLAAGFQSEALLVGAEINRVNKTLGLRDIQKIDVLEEETLSLEMQDGDILNIPSVTALNEIHIELSGQFKYPGFYSVQNGEKLSNLLKRAGGFTESAYLYAAILTRKSVAEMQNSSFRRTAEDMETAIAAAIVSGQVTGDVKAASELIWRLRNTKSPGRLVVDIDPINIESDPEKDIFLENGDRIHVPVRSHSVTVVGDVYAPATIPFKSSFKSRDYINRTGGFRLSADKSQVFVILPDGQARSAKAGIWRFGNEYIAPGSTLVIPRDTQPFNWLVLSESIAPVVANLATSAAAIAAINVANDRL